MKSLFQIALLSFAIAAVMAGTAMYTAQAADDDSAKLFAPPTLNKIPGEIDERAPSAFDDPSEIGDPNAIGDPNSRAPGLLK